MTLGEFRKKTKHLSDDMDLILEIDLGDKNEINLNIDDVSHTNTEVLISNEIPEVYPVI